jgi:hypothetical protein
VNIRAVLIDEYKAVSAVLAWSQAVVLFGRNDVGKSNILEAVAWAGGLETARHDPSAEPGEPLVTYLVELDPSDADGADSKLLAALLQMRHVPPLFPYPDPDVPPPTEREDSGTYLSQFPAAALAWDFGDGQGGARFHLGCVGEMYSPLDPVNTVGSLDEVRSALQKEAHAFARDALAASGREAAAEPFLELLDRCLGSRWLLCSAGGGVTWLAPRRQECDAHDIEAAHRLAESFGSERIPILDEFARELVDGRSGATPFLSLPQNFRPWDVVRVSSSPERLEDLARDVEAFARENLDLVLDARGDAADPWLAPNDSGSISNGVAVICERLSDHATRIAPPFVTRDYHVNVRPLGQKEWFRHGNRRVRLELVRSDGNTAHELSIAGSGLAIWAGFAVEEAMREVGMEFYEKLATLIAEATAREDDRYAPRQEPASGTSGRLYVFDEPERHLHPGAQEQAARWLAGRVDESTSLLLATHAVPFLSLPTARIEYALVTRGSDGITRTESITKDTWGALDRRVKDAGLSSRAELLQLARAFLIVEGSHDEKVLRHFYGEPLDTDRIFVLPIHGAKKVGALIDSQILARIDVPLIILFDDIRAPALVREDEPSKRDVALHQLWHLLRSWPPERRPPHVVEFGVPDIYCALPDQCVRQVVTDHGGSFNSWNAVIKRFRAAANAGGFKPFFLEQSGLPRDTDTDALLDEILERCRRKPRTALQRAVTEARERATLDLEAMPAADSLP